MYKVYKICFICNIYLKSKRLCCNQIKLLSLVAIK